MSRSSFIERNSLQFILSVAFTLTAMFGTIIMGAALNWHFTRSMTHIIERDHHQMIRQVDVYMDSYLRYMMKLSDTAYAAVVSLEDGSREEMDTSLDAIYNMWNNHLVALALFDREGELVSCAPRAGVKPGVRPREAEWFTSALGSGEAYHFSDPHVQNLFAETAPPYQWTISLTRPISMSLNGKDFTGVLLVEQNFSWAEEIGKEAQIGPNGYIYITDSSGEIIFHPRQQLLYSGLLTENNPEEALFADGVHQTRFDGHNRLVTVKTHNVTGWKVVGVGYMDDIMLYARTSLLAAIAFVGALGVLIFVNYIVSARITRPIRQLEQTVLMIDRGNLDVPVSVGGAMEIRHLGQAIQALLLRVRVLMDDIVAEQEQKKKYEYDMLQAQVNPHFLYNALDSIIRMIEWGDRIKAAQMVKALSKFFRVTLSRESCGIPVADEIEHVRSYLTIQKSRFQESFRFAIDVEPRVLGLRTIKLILQPIVENAINHGLNFIDGDGLIAVRAYLGGDGALYMEVLDDGCGMPPERLDALLTKPVNDSRGSGMGLYNVQQRIRLYYGHEYGLTIVSEPDVGTCVVVRLPAKPYEEESP